MPGARGWSMPPAAPRSSAGCGNSDLIAQGHWKRSIAQELSGIRVCVRGDAGGLGGDLRQQTERGLDRSGASQQDEQPPARRSSPNPRTAPDFYPFAELPAGTIIRDLPDGGKLFILPDGLILRTGCENTMIVIDAERRHQYPFTPGRWWHCDHCSRASASTGTQDFLHMTHEAAGIEGLPVGVDAGPVRAGSRQRSSLPGGTTAGCSSGIPGCIMVIIITSGSQSALLAPGRIEGIGEEILCTVRLLAGGLRNFHVHCRAAMPEWWRRMARSSCASPVART